MDGQNLLIANSPPYHFMDILPIKTLVPGANAPIVDTTQIHYGSVYPVAGGAPVDSKDWSSSMPPFKYQGWVPACTAFATRAIIYCLNKVFDNREAEIDPLWLFFASGGTKNGNYLENPAHTAINQGAVYEQDKPYPDVNAYSYETWDSLRSYALAITPQAIQKALENRLKAISSVDPNNQAEVVDALSHSPLALIIPVYHPYFDAMNGFTISPSPVYHAVTLVKKFADGHIKIFDSLTVTQNFDGFHELPANYPIVAALSYRDLPNDAARVQLSWAQQSYPVAYDHYNLPRLPLEVEQSKAEYLRKLVESYPDVGIRAIASKFWIVLVNAYLYGGYSAEVTGPDGKLYFAYKEHGSDLANALYQYRRTGQFPFNFDKLRSEQ